MKRAGMGEKRRCLSCNTAFFDLDRAPIVCPKCAVVFQVIEPVRSSVGRIGAFQNRTRWAPPLSKPSPVDSVPESDDEADADLSPDVTGEETPEIEVIEESA